jgi:hypothetical protein
VKNDAEESGALHFSRGVEVRQPCTGQVGKDNAQAHRKEDVGFGTLDDGDGYEPDPDED